MIYFLENIVGKNRNQLHTIIFKANFLIQVMAENKRYLYWIIGIVAIIVITYLIYLIYPRASGIDKATAECIGQNSIVYISTGCIACQAQEKLFGGNFKYLNTIDCAVTPEKCSDITSVPTWIINDKKLVGIQLISTLKQLTGC